MIKVKDIYRLDEICARNYVAPFLMDYLSANTITLITLILAVVGASCIFLGWVWVGILLFVLGRFLDHADGEVARLNNAASPFGQFYDLSVGSISFAILYIAIGYLYDMNIIVVTFAATIGFFNRWIEYGSGVLLKPKEDSNIIHYMSCHENGGLFYWLLIPLAMVDLLNWYVIISMIGHVLYIVYYVRLTYVYLEDKFLQQEAMNNLEESLK